MESYCPNCGTHLECPCKHCKKAGLTKDTDATWVWLEDGNLASCSVCNFTAHADTWENIYSKQYENKLLYLIKRKLIKFTYYLYTLQIFKNKGV